MSKLIVQVQTVTKVEPHPNADRLAIATVMGWKTCIKFDPQTGRAQFSVGDGCIFFPPDAVLPPQLANGPDGDPPGRLGVMNYLAPLPEGLDGVIPPGGRVRAARLRGIPSYGVVMALDPAFGDDPDWSVGTDLADHFGITKWEPPINSEEDAGDHVLFHRYTEIENIGNFPGAIPDGLEVVFTEKIHGKNSRSGCVIDTGDGGTSAWLLSAGSHEMRRREYEVSGNRSPFWEVLTDNVRALINYVRDEMPWPDPKFSVLLFGEMYGSGVQDMAYGLIDGAHGYRAFDLAVNGQYLDFDTKRELFARFGIEMVPILYRGPFSMAKVEEYTNGPTTVCEPKQAGSFKGREGIVITPVREQLSQVLNGRLILKSVSADYLARKGATDSH